VNQLVMYNFHTNEIKLWEKNGIYWKWKGPEFVAWFALETCLEYGWEVIGEL
jgi:hypothetical protein